MWGHIQNKHKLEPKSLKKQPRLQGRYLEAQTGNCAPRYRTRLNFLKLLPGDSQAHLLLLKGALCTAVLLLLQSFSAASHPGSFLPGGLGPFLLALSSVRCPSQHCRSRPLGSNLLPLSRQEGETRCLYFTAFSSKKPFWVPLSTFCRRQYSFKGRQRKPWRRKKKKNQTILWNTFFYHSKQIITVWECIWADSSIGFLFNRLLCSFLRF